MEKKSKTCSFCDNEIKKMNITHQVNMGSSEISRGQKCICRKCASSHDFSKENIKDSMCYKTKTDYTFLNCIHVN